MAITEARKRTNQKYHQKFDEVRIRVPKGEKDIISTHAAEQGESVNTFVRRAISETIAKDKSAK